ncbi:MAG: GbsR/MarR family transcriptional regulator [Polymorphobacter sp.]
MTETADTLPPAVQRFILHWGDMGDQWGVNRSVAQIHALLYLAEAPLTAEDIADSLALARSNVSNSLKELQGWRLVRRVPMLGDRRDHYEAETDLWEIIARIAHGRKEREIDPVHAALVACVDDARADPRVGRVALGRLLAMLEFVTTLVRWYEQMIRLPRSQIAGLIKLGGKVAGLLGRGKAGKAEA